MMTWEGVTTWTHHLFKLKFLKVLEDDRTGDGDEAEDIYRRSRMNYKDIPRGSNPPHPGCQSPPRFLDIFSGVSL